MMGIDYKLQLLLEKLKNYARKVVRKAVKSSLESCRYRN